MQNNPEQLPTWDEFLRPLLELASESSIMRRTSVQKIAEKFAFSEEIRSSRTKSGQTHIENRSGWAMSALVKAKFIEKHPTEKFTYQITNKGREYLKDHKGPITDQDLKNLDGYEEAWEAASRKKQNSKAEPPWSDNSLAQSTPDDLIDTAYNKLHRSLADKLLENMFVMDPYKFEQLVIDLLFSMGYGGSRNEAAQVTKKSNDEGIDGIINEDRLGLDVIYI